MKALQLVSLAITLVLSTLAHARAQQASATLVALPVDCQATKQPLFVIKDSNQLPVLGGLFFAPKLSGDSVDEKALGHGFTEVWGLYWFAMSVHGGSPFDIILGGRRACGRLVVAADSVHAAHLPLALWQVIQPKELGRAFRVPNDPALVGARFYGQGALLYEDAQRRTMLLSSNYVRYVAGY
ncbi:MAG: hypothetical protein KDC95_02430 [Planctomycetes bacterium]|nr:hypothetical protein [Planctomycetota bacterium]